MAAHTWDDSMKVECKRLLDLGTTYREVGEATGVPYQTIAKWYPGLKVRRPTAMTVQREKGQKLTSDDKLKIYDLVNCQRMTHKQAAREMNCSPATVGDVLARDGGDPVVQKYRQQRDIEELDKRREMRLLLLDALPDLPKVNVDQTARAIKSITPDGPLVQVDTGNDRPKIMDLARLIADAERRGAAEALAKLPVSIGTARITDKAA